MFAVSSIYTLKGGCIYLFSHQSSDAALRKLAFLLHLTCALCISFRTGRAEDLLRRKACAFLYPPHLPEGFERLQPLARHRYAHICILGYLAVCARAYVIMHVCICMYILFFIRMHIIYIYIYIYTYLDIHVFRAVIRIYVYINFYTYAYYIYVSRYPYISSGDTYKCIYL